MDPTNLRFNHDYTQKVTHLVAAQKDKVNDEVQLRLQTLFRDSPYQVREELDDLFRKLLP